jgi:hypothetical protein
VAQSQALRERDELKSFYELFGQMLNYLKAGRAVNIVIGRKRVADQNRVRHFHLRQHAEEEPQRKSDYIAQRTETLSL